MSSELIILTDSVPDDIQIKLQGILDRYSELGRRVVRAHQQRAAALVDAGCADAASAATSEAAALQTCIAGNCSVIGGFFTSAPFVQSDWTLNVDGMESSKEEHSFVDAIEVLLQSMVRDWSDVCLSIRHAIYDPVIGRVSRAVNAAGKKGKVKIWVPGCGMGRLALELQSSLGGTVIASDESPAALAAVAGLIQRGRAGCSVFPAATVLSPGLDGPRGRTKKDDIIIPPQLRVIFSSGQLEATEERKLELQHFSLDHAPDREGEFDAVVTVFTLARAVDFPRAVKKIANSLKAGGVWVNCGPLYMNKAKEKTCFTFEDTVALAKANRLEVLEDTRIEHVDYIPKEAFPGSRDVYDVQLLVARKLR